MYRRRTTTSFARDWRSIVCALPDAEKQMAPPGLGEAIEIGGPCRIRTYDQRIKSPLLYQLS